ncbi:MAG: hypothetical protein J7501_00095 [Bdellovibrio sp.]|nr:hypothetical protein [Bdellovibrio sp.]
MISKKAVLSQLAMIAVLGASTSALAADRFSVEDWGKSFKASLSEKSGKTTLDLLDFKKLENKTISAESEAKNKIKKARELFAKGKFDQSLELYNQIPKGSDYWFQAVEEKGWAYFRKNDSEKAIAQSKTLISPQFAEVVNSEAFLLQSLANLKICNYKEVFNTTQMFKEKQRERIASVQILSKEGFSDSFINVLKKVNKFPLQASDVGESLVDMPVLYYKDLELQRQMLRFKVSQKAMEILRDNGTQAKLQGQLDKINQEAFGKMKLRLKALASQETQDNKKVVAKLNLVEVEAIQRIHTDQQLDKKAFTENKFRETTDDQLVFMDDGKPWIDELDKYDVVTKSCPQNVRRKM